MSNYHPEPYWSEVADKIAARGDENVVAGDDEPYYRYKRRAFLKLLNSVKFQGEKVLEIGNGPGGNLREVWKHNPKSLTGVDISQQMVDLAKKHNHPDVNILKINGTELPFQDQTFDIVFTATVLQHNTDEAMLKQIMAELSRVAASRVFLFERIESEILGDELCYGRPVNYYEEIMKSNGYMLKNTAFVNVRVSYYVCGAIRKLFNPSSRKEGDPLNKFSIFLEKMTLPITKVLDRVFTSKKDVAKLEFERIHS